MRILIRVMLVASAAGLFATVVAQEPGAVAPSPNGIELPAGYKDWRMVASSCRSDNNTMRVILGNDAAIAAARAGETNPWPDGVILAKLVWKQTPHPKWETAAVPGDFVQAEFMVKDSTRYASTGGWGFARWLGMEQEPFGEDATFASTCFGCHTPMADNDYVFTRPAALP